MEDSAKRFENLVTQNKIIHDTAISVAQFWWEKGFNQGREYQKEQNTVEVCVGNIVYFFLGVMASVFVSILFSL